MFGGSAYFLLAKALNIKLLYVIKSFCGVYIGGILLFFTDKHVRISE